MDRDKLKARFSYWLEALRLKGHWDVTLRFVEDASFTKTGDFKVDPDDKKAVLLLNAKNPKYENLEEVIIHELMHLKLYPLDQVTEGLIDAHYEQGSDEHRFAYGQFMLTLEQTVAELTKCYLRAFGEDKKLSYGRVDAQQGFNALYEGLKPYGDDTEK